MNLLDSTLGGVGTAIGFSLICRDDSGKKIRLRPDAIFAAEPCRTGSQEVLCHGGVLWVTQKGVQEDMILKQGQRVRLRNRGRVVIQALEAAAFSIVKMP